MTVPSFGSSGVIDDSVTAIPHDNVDDSADPLLTDLGFTADGTELPPIDPDNPYDEFLRADEPEFEPDLRLVEPKKRPPRARQYERKVSGVFAIGIKLSIGNSRTLADSAALIMHGPNIAEKAGDLAAVNPKAAAMIDMITDQTESPATALIVATMPLILQLARNHELSVETRERGIKLPRGRRLKFRIPFNLGKRLPWRNLTTSPAELTHTVLSNDKVREALDKQGIRIVINP